ncbi:MAG: pilus assembly protein [Planctomycetes bacterium]|nr:pilus assembly protein [Planctomycetota bacterium]
MVPAIRSRRSHQRSRRGVAAVELALVLPFLIVLAFGMLEYNRSVMLKTRMISAAYEAARMATRPTTSSTTAASAAGVKSYCNSLLTQLNVHGATVTVSPESLGSASPQTLVTVSITAPFGPNSMSCIVLSPTYVVTASASLVVE